MTTPGPATRPALPAFDDGRGRTLVWCDHCRAWHKHGAGAAGHRSAHCPDPASPYDRTA